MILSPLDEEENIGLQQSNVPQDVNEKNFEGWSRLNNLSMLSEVASCCCLADSCCHSGFKLLGKIFLLSSSHISMVDL